PLGPVHNFCDTPRWHRLSPSTFEGSLGDFTVIKVPAGLPPGLVSFVSLSTNDDGVPGLGAGEYVLHSPLTLREGHIVRSAFHPGDDCVNNALRVLRARIVGRDDGVITQPGDHLSHQRTLPRITIPTAPKYRDQTTRCFRPYEL